MTLNEDTDHHPLRPLHPLLSNLKMILDGVEWFRKDNNVCKCLRMTEDDTEWC